MVEKIIWTRKALADLHIIYDFIGKDSLYYANLTVQQIVNKSGLIKNSTQAGRIVPEFADPKLGEFLYKDYTIIYRIQNSIAYVVRIYHSSRLFKQAII